MNGYICKWVDINRLHGDPSEKLPEASVSLKDIAEAYSLIARLK